MGRANHNLVLPARLPYNGATTNGAAADFAGVTVQGKCVKRRLRMRRVQWGITLSLVVGVLFATAPLLPAAELVSSWGDFSRLSIEGTKAFTAAEIQQGWESDIQLVLAAHPSRPLADFRQKLAARTLDGYLSSGFPDAQVTAIIDYDSESIRVFVTEGERYKQGRIIVRGGTPEIQEYLTQWLTTRQPEEGKVDSFEEKSLFQGKYSFGDRDSHLRNETWKIGDIASSRSARLSKISADVRRALSEQAFHCDKFDVSLAREEDHIVDLVIAFKELGPPTAIYKMVVTGNHRDSSGDILRYLGLRPGVVLKEPERAQLVRRLRESGRYVEQKVAIETPLFGEPYLRMKIVEQPDVSPLTAELTAEEAAFQRFRQWLLAALDQDRPLRISLPLAGADAKLFLSSNKGGFCVIEPVERPDDGKEEAPSGRSIETQPVVLASRGRAPFACGREASSSSRSIASLIWCSNLAYARDWTPRIQGTSMNLHLATVLTIESRRRVTATFAGPAI